MLSIKKDSEKMIYLPIAIQVANTFGFVSITFNLGYINLVAVGVI